MEHFVRYQKYWLWGIIFATFAVSLAYSFYFQIQPIVDARAYDNLAWDIARGKGYEAVSSIARPGPAYEYFLALIYYIFGHHYAAVWIFQAALLAATAYFVFRVSKFAMPANWHPFIGLLAAGLVGFSPDLITVSAMLMTESLFLFLIVAGTYFFLKNFHSNHLGWLILSAIFWAGAVLTRSNLLFALLPLIIFLFYKKEFKGLVFFLITLAICFTPWTVRNYLVFGELRPFNAAYALLYVGNNPESTGELGPYPLPNGYGDFSKMNQIENDQALYAAGKDYIFSHPLDFARKTIWRVSIYFSSARPFAFWPHLEGIGRLITAIASSAYAGFIFSFGLAGVVLAFSQKLLFSREKLLLLASVFFLVPVPLIFLIVETRYRFPSYPFLAIFASWFAYLLLTRRQEIFTSMKRLAFVWLALLGNTIFDVVRNFSRIADRI